MCRIYGYFNATVALTELRTVGALQRHGGPDATGSEHGVGWGLGHNRLAVVDLDGGRQPYRLDDRVTVVFNGEIYNHDDLRAQLRGRGYDFPDRCDGGIIPALYDAYGEGFVDLLDGMFAVAVLDRRARPTLLLATDGMGMKPLYYRWDAVARSLHFASEIPAMFGFTDVDTSIRTAGLDAVLAGRTPFGERTAFSDIHVLPPATTMVCALGGEPRTVRRAPPAAGAVPDGLVGTVAERVRDTLRAEVGRLLVADVPVAVITSGGLDSGLVTAFAAERGAVHAFNIGYRGDWPFDERHHARAVTRHTGAVHHQVEIDPATFPAMIEDVVRHLGQPNADPITLSTYALFAAVRGAGFPVALSGDAADEVFGGYARMHDAVADEAAGVDWCSRYLDAIAVLPAAERVGLYTDDYRDAVAGTSPLPIEAVQALRHGPGTALARITEFELGHRLPAYHLRRVDHLSMASSVEVRVPFCQPSVVALGRSLTDDQRIRGAAVKRTLYAAAQGLLPDTVLRRPKQPFTLPVAAMLRPGTPLWELARDVLAAPALRAAGQLDPRSVEALFARQAARPDPARPDPVAAATLWALMVHEVWRTTVGRGARGVAAPEVAAA